jgi:hypothetical protein
VCEIAFVAAVERHQGIGSALLGALRREVADCERMWLFRDELELEARITDTYGSAHMAATPIPHFAAASLMRPLTIPHGTRNGFFVHWISSSSDLAS